MKMIVKLQPQPCLGAGADLKTRGLWERDSKILQIHRGEINTYSTTPLHTCMSRRVSTTVRSIKKTIKSFGAI